MQLAGLKLEPGMKIVVDTSPPPPPPPGGHYYVATFGNDFASPNGVQALLEGTTALAYDKFDNLYATGLGKTNAIGNQGVTIKFNPDGTVNWQNILSTGSANNYTFFYSVGLDVSNNLYVCGTSTLNWLDAQKSPTYQLAKYNKNGGLIWQRNLGYSLTNSVPKFGNGLAIDKKTSEVYVVGDQVTTPPNVTQLTDMTVVKYGPDGSIVWAKSLGNSGTSDHCNAVALDSTLSSAGNVYLAGSTVYNGKNQAALIKYNSRGVLQWQKCFIGGGGDDIPGTIREYTGIAIDSSNNIFVCGRDSYNDGVEGAIAKYDSSGNFLWCRILGRWGYQVFLIGIGLDSLGNVYAVGKELNDGIIVKYNSSGVLQWKLRVQTSSNYGTHFGMNTDLTSITFDSSDTMTIGGTTSLNTDINMLIIKIASDGSTTGSFYVNNIQVSIEVGDYYADLSLPDATVTTTMYSAGVNYFDAGPSTLDSITGNFVNSVTPIP
jgi:hypothetical protein